MASNSAPGNRPEIVAGLTYALGLADLGMPSRIARLPSKFLENVFDGKEGKYRRADVDGALAAGLKCEEFAGAVAAARSFSDDPAAIHVKVAAIWRIHHQKLFDDPTPITSLLENASLQEKHSSLKVIAGHAKSFAFDKVNKRYDPALINTLSQQVKDLFVRLLPGIRIEDIRRLMSDPGDRPPSASSLEDFGMMVVDNKVCKQRGQELDLITNFIVIAIRTGQLSFLDRPPTQVHRVRIRLSSHGCEYEIEVHGSIYEAKGFETAGAGYLTISSPVNFKAYIAHIIDNSRLQTFDRSVDRTLMVGAVRNGSGKLVPNDDITFPHREDECPYHAHRFSDEGDASAFALLAGLFTDMSVAFIVIWGLGSILKAALGWAYAHCVVEGDFGSGKNTLNDIFASTLGWISRSGPTEFLTSYRTKKTFANTVLPVQIDEVGRVHDRARTNMVDVLNLAYNKNITTHGDEDKTFVLAAPGLLWGQDFASEDVALNAKTVRITLHGDKKNPAALRELRKTAQKWPMRRWVAFACEYANSHDLAVPIEGYRARLLERIPADRLRQSSNVDRFFWNYAVALMVADVLKEFGAEVDLQALFEFVINLITRHLEEMFGADGHEDRGTVALQFLRDLLEAIPTTSAQNELVFDLTPEGLFFRVPNAIEFLHRRGRRYDISKPAKIQAMLVREKLVIPSVQHRKGVLQQRFSLVPSDVLNQLGFQFERRAGSSPEEL